MKQNYYLFLFIFFFSTALKSQNINIPDANFKQYLLSSYDFNYDGEISAEEALQVTIISCSGKNIASLEGIRSFINLKTLSCANNQLTSLDLRGLSKLETLNCWLNQLSELNLEGAINLLTLRCDNNKLTSLNLSESGLSKLGHIDCYNNKIVSINLNGLSSLKTIDCSTNPLKSLNVKNCLNLQYITVIDSSLENLDLSNLTNLLGVNLNKNYLTSLNLQGSKMLQQIFVRETNLTSLDLQDFPNLLSAEFAINSQLTQLNLKGCNKLQTLTCYDSQLEDLNIEECTSLNTLSLGNNNLNSLNLGGMSKLVFLNCNNNKLKTLDIKDCINLDELYLGDNMLTSLFLKNGKKNSPYLVGNPNLKFICCDQFEIDYLNYYLVQADIQNQCVLNSYCSFTPGGNYNTVKGSVKIDSDNNGCDVNDLSFFPLKFYMTKNSVSDLLIGNDDGSYKYFVNDGTYTITPFFENPDYFTATPSNKQIFFANNNNNVETQDFCISSNGTKNDLEIKIIPENSVRPGFNTSFKLIYKNKGNTVLSGDIRMTFDNLKSQFISASSSPNSSTAGNLQWNFTNIKPYESKIIMVVLKTLAPPTVNNGDLLTYKAVINPIFQDLTDYDNTFSLKQTVVGSYDPNDKICLEGNIINPNMIGKYITYKIRFENTGTANAEQVVIKDVINSTMFDIKSLIPITASHSYSTRITGNTVEFNFENIDLPFDDANNDGYIVFKIKTTTNLVVGSTIKNKADIFFDYNLPIITNEFSSIFQNLGTEDNHLKKSINIYPNPAKEFIKIDSSEKIFSIEIYDTAGRLLQKNNYPEIKIDIKDLKQGLYVLKISTIRGNYIHKLIKD